MGTEEGIVGAWVLADKLAVLWGAMLAWVTQVPVELAKTVSAFVMIISLGTLTFSTPALPLVVLTTRWLHRQYYSWTNCHPGGFNGMHYRQPRGGDVR